MRCSRCNAEIPEGKRFCPECFWDSRPGQESQPTRTSEPVRNREQQFSIFHPLTFHFFAIALMISYFPYVIHLEWRNMFNLDYSLIKPLDTIYLIGTILIGLAILLASFLKIHRRIKFLGWLGLFLFFIGSIIFLLLLPINYIYLQFGMIILFTGLTLSTIHYSYEGKHVWKAGLIGLLLGKVIVVALPAISFYVVAIPYTVLFIILAALSLVAQIIALILVKQDKFFNAEKMKFPPLNSILLVLGLGLIWVITKRIM